MKITTINNGYEQHELLLKRCITERIAVEFTDGGITIELCIDENLGAEESYQIIGHEDEWKIIGSDKLGLYYGIGKFLHSATWDDKSFVPKETGRVVTPACPYRAIYFSIHFYNWYYMASIEELQHYLEEMLLWGYNCAHAILPVVHVDSFEDKEFIEQAERTRNLYKVAKSLGMKIGTTIGPNQGLNSAPDELRADPSCYEHRTGGGGKNVCPAKEGAIDYLRPLWIKNFETYKDLGLDYIITWPFDEGGRGCEKCRPWGGNGYLDLIKILHKDAKEWHPNAKLIVSAWYFDEYFEGPHEQGEFEALYRRLKADLSYVDYIMVDSHNDFPHYVLEHEVIKPIVNFPEISMYGVRSWGGRGANPLPKRFQRIWDSSKRVLSGGMPYSEGMYEDISKIQCVGYYWEPNRHYRDILGEYISYEYTQDVVDEVLEMMELIEENHVRVRTGHEPNMEAAVCAEQLALVINDKLTGRAKTCWRWRILFIRARIDRMLYDYHVEHCQGKEKALYELWNTREHYLRDNDEAQELLQELCRWYKTQDKHAFNKWTFPPVKDGKVLK